METILNFFLLSVSESDQSERGKELITPTSAGRCHAAIWVVIYLSSTWRRNYGYFFLEGVPSPYCRTRHPFRDGWVSGQPKGLTEVSTVTVVSMRGAVADKPALARAAARFPRSLDTGRAMKSQVASPTIQMDR